MDGHVGRPEAGSLRAVSRSWSAPCGWHWPWRRSGSAPARPHVNGHGHAPTSWRPVTIAELAARIGRDEQHTRRLLQPIVEADDGYVFAEPYRRQLAGCSPSALADTV